MPAGTERLLLRFPKFVRSSGISRSNQVPDHRSNQDGLGYSHSGSRQGGIPQQRAVLGYRTFSRSGEDYPLCKGPSGNRARVRQRRVRCRFRSAFVLHRQGTNRTGRARDSRERRRSERTQIRRIPHGEFRPPTPPSQTATPPHLTESPTDGATCSTLGASTSDAIQQSGSKVPAAQYRRIRQMSPNHRYG